MSGFRLLRVLGVAVICAQATNGTLAAATSRGPDAEARLRALQDQVQQLERERAALQRRERGVLTDLEQTRAELRLARARLEQLDIELSSVREEIAVRNERIETLEGLQAERRAYLAVRVRQLYLEGPSRTARIALGSDDIEEYLGGLRDVGWLSERDRDVLRDFRADQTRMRAEHEQLSSQQARLAAVRQSTATVRTELDAAGRRQARLLERLREDRDLRERAVEELASAADSLSGLVDARSVPDGLVRPDLAKFRGLLDPPIEGAIAERFGDVVHPRFKTRVPHPGIDFAAREGTPFRAVFDARVLFAGWLRGYGLTAILDHGHGAVTVYAHASALIVEEGEEVLRSQTLGYVGETGSTTGPSLYFELRRESEPIDPEPWFR